MADTKISDMTAAVEADLALTDLVVVVDNVATTPVTKKMTLEEFRNLILGYVANYGYLGRAEILSNRPTNTSGAPLNVLVGASTPAEQHTYFSFVNGSVTYRELECRLISYNGGGLTVEFEVLRTSAAAAETYIFEAAIRRENTGSEDLGASHTYAYNAVTITVPAGPPNAGIPMAGAITFTDGADMDSLATGDAFILRLRRNGGTATDTARVMSTITIRETS